MKGLGRNTMIPSYTKLNISTMGPLGMNCLITNLWGGIHGC